MKPDLEATRLAAVSVLGRNGQKIMAQLEGAGLVVVKSADLVQQPVTLEAVRLNLREPWDGLAPIWAERPGHPDGEIVVLEVMLDAVASVREAALLQQVTGARVDLALNARGEVAAAWTVDARPVRKCWARQSSTSRTTPCAVRRGRAWSVQRFLICRHGHRRGMLASVR